MEFDFVFRFEYEALTVDRFPRIFFSFERLIQDQTATWIQLMVLFPIIFPSFLRAFKFLGKKERNGKNVKTIHQAAEQLKVRVSVSQRREKSMNFYFYSSVFLHNSQIQPHLKEAMKT